MRIHHPRLSQQRKNGLLHFKAGLHSQLYLGRLFEESFLFVFAFVFELAEWFVGVVNVDGGKEDTVRFGQSDLFFLLFFS